MFPAGKNGVVDTKLTVSVTPRRVVTTEFRSLKSQHCAAFGKIVLGTAPTFEAIKNVDLKQISLISLEITVYIL